MITISKKQAHVRYFLWCDELWERFTGDTYYYPLKNPNVCYYIRTMTLKPLTMLLCYLVIFIDIVFVFLALPIYYLGIINFVGSLITIGVFVLSIYGAVLLDRKTKIITKFFTERGKCVEKKGNKCASLFGIIGQWILDKHDKICSIMEIKDL